MSGTIVGSLAYTGIDLGIFVLIAVAALVLGAFFMAWALKRRGREH